MPKSSSSASITSEHRRELMLNGAANAGVLKRNQACHQCRKRKLKCDAKRPCSTCLRSHNHAIAHARPDAILPPYPECTFDELRDPIIASNDTPKSKYEKLESRINELETLLRQKDSGAPGNGASFSLSDDSTYGANRDYPLSESDFHISPNGFLSTDIPANALSGESSGLPYHSSPGAFPNSIDFVDGNSPLQAAFITSGSPELDNQLIWSSSPDLPETMLLKHLVDLFFMYHPHANRLLHRSTFMYNFSLPHTHPKFPCAALLHAICALSSNYTSAVTRPPFPDFDSGPTDDIFSAKARAKGRPDSFAEQQAKHAKRLTDFQTSMGDRMLENLQAVIILNWYYWSHARWVEVFVGSGLALRSCVPLAINVCPPFHSMQANVQVASILPRAQNVLEDELRRNAFFLSYVLDRQQGAGNGWATALDDYDITQVLPLRGDHFDKGLRVPPNDRQWFHQKDLLLTHPEDQTDSFSLLVKSCLLISRVKTFNLRYRARYVAGDPSVISQDSFAQEFPDEVDPRTAPAFVELDHILSEFKASFPGHLKHPITADNTVDVHLYSACLAPHVGTILLHEPHAIVSRVGCASAQKMLASARHILNLIYAVWTSSFDIALLDLFCASSWYICGRVFVKFVQAAREADTVDHAANFKNDLQSVQVALAKLGERVPLAFRYYQMLNNFTVRLLGDSMLSSQVVPTPEQSAFYASIP